MIQTITALTAQKRSKERVNVFLDGEYAFAVELLVALTLKIGQQLTPQEITQLQDEDAKSKTYHQALHFLRFRPRSRQEVLRNLRDKGYLEAHIDAALERLEGHGYVDDEEFARYWLENRSRFKPRSARAVRYELRQKGVENEVIDDVLVDLDEEAAARAALESKLGSWRHLDRATFDKRAMGFLGRRGFNYAIVRLVCDEGWALIEAENDAEN